MKQVWFCGAHTDVGGGYEEQELSDIPLVWMMLAAVNHGLRIYPKHKVKINQDINGEMHDSRGNAITKYYTPEERTWNSKTHGKPTVHQSVLERTHNKKNMKEPAYLPWILKDNYEIEPWDKRSTLLSLNEIS